jgi:hypothetical protein
MRTKRDVVDVIDSRLATMANGWCASFFFPHWSSFLSLTYVLIPQDRCRFPTVQTDVARKLLSPLFSF